MKKIASALMVLVAPCLVHASATVDREIGDLYDMSELVVTIVVTGIWAECKDGPSCALYKISGKLENPMNEKYNVKGRLKFCTTMPLEVNEKYTIFLFKESGKPFDSIGCNLVAPVDGVFQYRSGSVYRINSAESSLIFELDGKSYRSSAVFVPEFDEKIKELEEKNRRH